MKTFKKILYVWVALVGIALLSLLLPHKETGPINHLNTLIQMLLFVTSIYLVKVEPTKKNKFIFLNLSMLFGFSLVFHIYNFIPDSGYLRLFFFQYGIIGYYFILAFAIGFITIDLIFREWKSLAKYALTTAIVAIATLYYFLPFVVDPLHIYRTDDVVLFSILEDAFSAHVTATGENPTIHELVAALSVNAIEGSSVSQSLSVGESTEVVERLYPYLFENNYVVLFVRPIYLASLYFSVVSIGLIILFFAYQYLKDPPQGAYIEKIMFLLLVYCTMEALHAWSYVKSVEWYSFYEIMNLGQMISIGVLVLIGVFFLLRLRFITSPNGEFYEQEIATSPAGITRWKDMFDELMIAYFLNTKNVVGRLFVDRKGVA